MILNSDIPLKTDSQKPYWSNRKFQCESAYQIYVFFLTVDICIITFNTLCMVSNKSFEKYIYIILCLTYSSYVSHLKYFFLLNITAYTAQICEYQYMECERQVKSIY